MPLINRRRAKDGADRDLREAIAAQRDILTRLRPDSDAGDLLHRATELVEDYLPTVHAAIMIRDRAADMLTLASGPSLPTELRGRLVELPLDSAGPSCVSAIRRREPVLIPDIQNDPSSSRIQDACSSAGFDAVWSIPLFSRTRAREHSTTGTLDLYLSSSQDVTGSPEDISDLADLVALIVDRHDWVHRSRNQRRECPLTGLPNRAAFLEDLQEHIERNREAGGAERRLGVGLLDIDGFKDLNDALGFRVGDLLLRALGERLQEGLRAGDVLARTGSNSFLILFTELHRSDEIGQVADDILQLVNQPYDFGGHGLYISASMGLSVFPWDGEDTETLVRNAETALRAAKDRGGGHHQLFHPTMAQHRPTLESWFEQTKMGSELREALARDQLELHYQPKVDAMDDGRIAGAEALLRWNHPEMGIVLPGRFMPLAERMGLTVEFGEWCLRQTTDQIRQWQRQGLPPIPVSVNISPLHFRRGQVVETVRSCLRRSGIEPRLLELEIVERLIMEDSRLVHSRLQDLHNLGVGLAIDDFGTGFSSLSYLGSFPLDTMKIDRSFIAQIGEDRAKTHSAKNIVRAILSLARTLSLSVVAEGVETLDQVEFLADNGCDLLQGFYFSRAVPPNDFAKLMARQEKRHQRSAAS